MLKLSVLLFFPLFAAAISPTHIACQLKKPEGISALAGCPHGTIYVSQTEKEATFSSVQAAVESLYVFHIFPQRAIPISLIDPKKERQLF